MQFDRLKRREFITLLGGAAGIWPFVASAQQPPKTAKVGILYSGMAASLRVSALREGLQPAGYREPDNIELLQRAAEGDPKRDNRTVGERGRRGKQKGILQIRPNRIDSTSGLNAVAAKFTGSTPFLRRPNSSGAAK